MDRGGPAAARGWGGGGRGRRSERTYRKPILRGRAPAVAATVPGLRACSQTLDLRIVVTEVVLPTFLARGGLPPPFGRSS
jgi:hypothetical protein